MLPAVVVGGGGHGGGGYGGGGYGGGGLGVRPDADDVSDDDSCGANDDDGGFQQIRTQSQMAREYVSKTWIKHKPEPLSL